MIFRKGMLDNTIIAYSHDNGGVPFAGALNYPLKGAKAGFCIGNSHQKKYPQCYCNFADKLAIISECSAALQAELG